MVVDHGTLEQGVAYGEYGHLGIQNNVPRGPGEGSAHQDAGVDHALRTAGGGSGPAFGAPPAQELDWVHGGQRKNPRRYRLSGQ
jgi:hypothetical protein